MYNASPDTKKVNPNSNGKPQAKQEIKIFPYIEKQNSLNKIFDKKLFFIMGMPKSGTTWLTNLLNGHPEVTCWGEGHMTNILRPTLEKAMRVYDGRVDQWHKKFQDMGLDQHAIQFTMNDLNYIFLSMVMMLFQKAAKDNPGVKCIGEKTPDNLYASAYLAFLFPHAKFIHLVRDGRDAAVSGWNMRQSMNDKKFLQQFPTFTKYAANFAKSWSQGCVKGRQFGQANPKKYIEVRYEDLHSKPNESMKRLFNFLDMPLDDANVNMAIENASFNKLSKGRKRGEEDNKSFFRRGVAGGWRDNYTELDKQAFWKNADKMLTAFGYEKD